MGELALFSERKVRSIGYLVEQSFGIWQGIVLCDIKLFTTKEAVEYVLGGVGVAWSKNNTIRISCLFIRRGERYGPRTQGCFHP